MSLSRTSEAVKTETKMSRLSSKTNRLRKMAASMSVPLKSSIGPNTRKDRIEPEEKDETKEDATKASEVEQREIK